jgi:transposase
MAWVLTSILNLRLLRPLKIEESEHDYHVQAESTTVTRQCGHCEGPSIIGFGRYEVLIRDLPTHGKRVGIYVQRRRFRCRSCMRTFSEALPEVDDKREMTSRLVQWIGKQSLKRPFAHIAEECGVADKTVRLIFADYVAEMQNGVRIEAPQMMGIDETHIIRRPRCVIGNMARVAT